MCEICRQMPCCHMCPNADVKIIGQCDQCEGDLTADVTYFADNAGNTFCSEACALAFYGVAETEYDNG